MTRKVIKETSDSFISNNEMVCYTEKMMSDGSLSEVNEEEEHLLEENVPSAIIKDAG
jgi:hypothetical protein